jgi:quercetin dioxygenase-like cupin family protein
MTNRFVWMISAFTGCALLGRPLLGQTGSARLQDSSAHHLNVKSSEMKWQKIFPELGARSAEIAMLHVDPTTQATQLMIRVPKNFHVPKHWHTANETHTIIKGTFILESEGKREALGPGSFNFIPKKMVHEAWTKPNEGALLFITVDGAWDVNWTDGPPKASDLIRQESRPKTP